MRSIVPLVALVLLVLACDDKPAPSPAPSTSMQASPEASGPAPSAPRPQPTPPTGVLSEEDFKLLHVLREDQAPPPRGTEVKLQSGNAYLSLPMEAAPPLPALVVIHEWWGLNQHIRHWTDRLAADGYAALAVDLYEGKVATDQDQAMKLMKAVDDARARAILKDAYRFLGEDSRIQATRRGSIGWCFGGKWSLELALDTPTLDAAVVYYGHVETHPARLAALEAPLLGIFGNEDKGIPPKMVDRFEFGLEQAGGKTYQLLRYDAEHAFANPSSGRYDEKAAGAAWAEVRTFLRKKLVEAD
jgi:carboxymethylenebutenolidase